MPPRVSSMRTIRINLRSGQLRPLSVIAGDYETSRLIVWLALLEHAMPYRPRNVHKTWTNNVGGVARSQIQSGFYANGVEVTTYSGEYWRVLPPSHKLPNGNWYTDPKQLLMQNFAQRSYGARNRAYERFKRNAVGENSSVGVAAAEWGQSFDMMSRRLTQLYKAFRAVKRGNLSEFADALGVPRTRFKRKFKRASNKRIARSAAGVILENNFGWLPLVMDLQSIAEVLSQPLPGGRAYGSAKTSLFYERVQYQSPYGYKDFYRYSGSIRYQVYAEVYLSNPNLFLANQLGLTNAGSVAWELIPFSFLIDWAFKVSNFIESFSDFMGCEVFNPGSSTFCAGTVDHISTDIPSPSWNQHYSHVVTESSRVPTLFRPVPTTEVIANLGDSKRRAASAAALLTQVLLGIKPSRHSFLEV